LSCLLGEKNASLTSFSLFDIIDSGGRAR